jgi:hypothetical protein
MRGTFAGFLVEAKRFIFKRYSEQNGKSNKFQKKI